MLLSGKSHQMVLPDSDIIEFTDYEKYFLSFLCRINDATLVRTESHCYRDGRKC